MVLPAQTVEDPVIPAIADIFSRIAQLLRAFHDILRPGIAQREHHAIGAAAGTVAAGDEERRARTARPEVDDLVADQLDFRSAQGRGLREQLLEIFAVEPAGGERAGLRAGVAGLEPGEEVARLVDQRARSSRREH